MSFDLLSMLAHAASEVNESNHSQEPAHEAPGQDSSTASPPGSTSMGSESTIHFSPRDQAKQPRLEAAPLECQHQKPQPTRTGAAGPQGDEGGVSAPSSPRVGCTEYECGYCGERKVSTFTPSLSKLQYEATSHLSLDIEKNAWTLRVNRCDSLLIFIQRMMVMLMFVVFHENGRFMSGEHRFSSLLRDDTCLAVTRASRFSPFRLSVVVGQPFQISLVSLVSNLPLPWMKI